MITPVNCPKGKKPNITTREPRGYWCAMGYKNITCPCGCLRTTAGYHKGGQAWRKAEAMAIEKWNQEVENQLAAQLRKEAGNA